MLIHDQITRVFGTVIDEGDELIDPGTRHFGGSFVVPVHCFRGIKTVPAHAIRHQFQVVDELDKLPLRVLNRGQRLLVQVVTHQRRDAQKWQTQRLDLQSSSV